MNAAIRFGAAAWLLFPAAAWAHQALEVGIPESLGEIPAPLRGSKEFFEEALPLLRPRCDAQRSRTLDEIERMQRDQRRIRWGAVGGVDPRAADYLRLQAEKSTIELLRSMPDALVIDLKDLDSVSDPFFAAELDARHSSLLLRVESGHGDTEFSVVDWDLRGESFDRSTELVVADRGTTFVVARLSSVPAEETTFRFSIRRRSDRDAATWRGVRVRSPAWGHLAIDLVDDRGRPTHALLSVRSREGGVYYQPSGAVDLRAQLNDVVGPPISEPGRGYFFFLPGEKRGRYWICPPRVEMTLPVGEWELRALRGPEQTPIVETVTIEAGQWTRREHRLRRWIDTRERGWWSGDDHIHARLMNGEDAEKLLDYAEAVDLNVGNILEMGDPYRTYYAQRGFGPAFRVSRGNHWLIPGQEDPRSDLGHAIGLNLREKVRDLELYLQNRALADQIHAGGGLYGHTHVGADACFVHREMALFTPLGIVDFNSVMQANLGTELWYDFLNLGFRMTATAGPDTPYGGTIGSTRVYAHTGRTDRLEPDAWFDAVRRGNTFVTNGPMLDFRVEGEFPGATIELDQPKKLRAHVTAVGLPGWSSPKRLSVVLLGEEIAIEESDDAGLGELKIETTIDPGDGCWIAAKAIGHDGSEAHTTPIYVSTGGARHWNPRRAPAILARQLEVLEEIEAMLKESERMVASRTQLLDRGSQVNAAQADAVRRQIVETRAIYERLLNEVRAAAP